MVLDIHLRSLFIISNFDFGKNVIIFGVDSSSLTHNDNRKKDILILGEWITQELDDILIIAKSKYSINFTTKRNKFCLSLHYNESNSFLYVNGVKLYQFKAKDILCLISS